MVANLKHFYQRRGLWFWYLVILIQLPPFFIFIFNPDKPMLVGILVINMLAGMMVASLQKDTLTKAFTFCLPGHRRLGRRLIFNVGIALNILLSLPFAAVRDNTSFSLLLLLAGIVSYGMIFYLSSVIFIMKSDSYPSIPGLFWVWGLLFAGGFLFHSQIYFALCLAPVVFVLVGVGISVLVWIWLGRDSHARRLCGKFCMDFVDRWNVDKLRRVRQMKEARKRRDNSEHPGWLERFTLSRMKRATELSRGRVLWGEFYAAGGPILSALPKFMLGILLVALLYGYFVGMIQRPVGPSPGIPHPMTALMNVIYILPAFMVVHWIIPVHCSLLTPAGRREKFVSGIFSAITITVVLTLMLLGLVVFFNFIQPYMPEIPVWFEKSGETLKFVAPLTSHVYLFPLLMPLGFAVVVLFRREPAALMFAGLLLWFFCIFLVGSWMLLKAGPIWMAMAGTWAVFGLVLRRHCMTRSLVGPGR